MFQVIFLYVHDFHTTFDMIINYRCQTLVPPQISLASLVVT
jgi:hypothetical protein